MRLKTAVEEKLGKHPVTKKLMDDKRHRMAAFAVLSLIINMMYAFYNGALGLVHNSSWFGAACTYHLLLGTMKFGAVVSHRRGDMQKENIMMGCTGAMLSVLSIVLAAILCISLGQNPAAEYGTITMITIAAYTFTKMTMAVIRAVKQRHDSSPLLRAIRTIGYAEVAASVFSMQQSMLVSFGDYGEHVVILNMCTGISVCLFTLVLGILLIKRSISYGKIQTCSGK